MSAKPRTTYAIDKSGRVTRFVARVAGYGKFELPVGLDTMRQTYRGVVEEVGQLTGIPSDYENFKLMFTAWWEAIAPWENVAYDIIIYDRFGRPLCAAIEHKPLVARRRMRELAESANGARGVVLRRNKRTMEVKQVAGFKRRTRRAPALAANP